jgi:hypothetical protein
MRTTTLSVKDKTRVNKTHPDRKYAEDHKVVQDHNIPLKNNKYLIKVISLRTYRVTLEIIKSVFIIFAFLLTSKVVGLYDLWIKLVENIFK